MRITNGFILLIVLSATCVQVTARNRGPRHARYWIETRPPLHKAKYDPDTARIVRLRDAKSGRIVWSHKTQFFRGAEWSTDHRAVAVENTDGLLVWREGEPLHSLGMPNDYFMGCMWAPDKHYLLVRGGNSGDSDIGPHGAGFLYYLKLGQGHISEYVRIAEMVSKARWQNNRTVRYWTYPDNWAASLKTKSHLWRAP